ncbi:hypothetical protein C2E31_20660, partial [Rhodopirellula baltica]
MNDSSKKLDPATVLSGTAGLADHLRRLGVQWLPQADEDRTTALAEFFAFGGSPPTDSAATAPPATQTPAASPTPGQNGGGVEFFDESFSDGLITHRLL